MGPADTPERYLCSIWHASHRGRHVLENPNLGADVILWASPRLLSPPSRGKCRGKSYEKSLAHIALVSQMAHGT